MFFLTTQSYLEAGFTINNVFENQPKYIVNIIK